jgi:hypothetical protein
MRSAESRRFLETYFKLLNTILLLGCRSPLPLSRRLLYRDEIVGEPLSESPLGAARSPGVGAPADTTGGGGDQALATVETGTLRRSRRIMTTFGD